MTDRLQTGGCMKLRARGSGKTPIYVTEIVKELVAKSSLLAVAKGSGIGIAAISRYLRGIGEPTLTTLQRLSDYSGKTFDIRIEPRSGDKIKMGGLL